MANALLGKQRKLPTWRTDIYLCERIQVKLEYRVNHSFQVGGEWSISGGSISTGTHIYDMTRELNGTLYYTEHRYYGRSHPTNNTSTENLRFLSVDQALADLAVFITHIKASSPDLANSGVIMVGGSYSGELTSIRNYLIASTLI